ncbi:MAG: AtpZ/AtpI family protein [Chloroflexi bacterium]|nr:AtpZ/AtpI family protein [Chloroflexota bacterium]MCI0784261.1 AtpZ/AtpI family protein [Chloroflexota bacterium]MCI0813683.1 AtpZ/AtpI family protein [Chloroflexota bacterium]MCI0817351.1 AtpZ/AtpI family protein [Chloroflexota bacterium]MCI0819194.1 AtpZ/AtpI family protein [Chloroflexota bacterium]
MQEIPYQMEAFAVTMQKLPQTMRLMGLGWYVALSIIGGIGGGVLIDGWLGTEPIFTLIGLFGGLLLAFWGGYFLLMEAIGKGRGSRANDAHD